MFQILAYLTLSFGISSTSWFVYEIGYLTQEPEYTCLYDSSVVSPPPCTSDNICSNNSAILSWDFDYKSDETLDNWQQKLSLTCVDDWKIGCIGASFFVGWAITLLWVPQFGDKYGRKKLFGLALCAQLFLWIGLLTTKHLSVMIVIWLSFGVLSSIRSNVGYPYLVELMPRKSQTLATTIWCV